MLHVLIAYRDCDLNGTWDAAINVTECQSAELDMLDTRVEDILNSPTVNVTDLSMISEDLSVLSNTSGVTAIAPEDLTKTNDILTSLIKLVIICIYVVHTYLAIVHLYQKPALLLNVSIHVCHTHLYN